MIKKVDLQITQISQIECDNRLENASLLKLE
jgi:hypothetical protein